MTATQQVKAASQAVPASAAASEPKKPIRKKKTSTPDANAASPVIETELTEVSAPPETLVPEDDLETRIARLFLEDYVTTALLRQGRAIPNDELVAASGVADFAPGQAALLHALERSRRVVARERDWDLALRVEAAQKPRAERSRQPLEGTLEELLKIMGKPLPMPVIVREVAALRGVLPEVVREGAAHVAQSARTLLEVAPGAWLHAGFLLDSELPTESLIVRENQLESDAAFRELGDHEFQTPAPDATLAQRATAILEQAARPLSQATLGFLLWKQEARRGMAAYFDARALAKILADRAVFYPFVGGLVTTQKQMPKWRALAQNWMQNQVAKADIAALLNIKLTADSLVAPRPRDLAVLQHEAKTSRAKTISILEAMTDTLEIAPDNPNFVPALQGLNQSLQNDATWISSGKGRFLLRESVPREVGQVPDNLLPIHLAVTSEEVFGDEMTDEGLEGDCADFIHDAKWEDVGEEAEAKPLRRGMSTHVGSESRGREGVRSVLLYPHHLAGTVRLRHMDESFFALDGNVARIPVQARDEEGSEELEAWISRDAGLIYGLVDWYSPRTPSSGGVLEWSRDESGQILMQLGAPDSQAFLDDDRVEQLELLMLENLENAPLFELLQRALGAHPDGIELPLLWAEINVLRRTTKRLMCSVLSAYSCFSFKPDEAKTLWRMDASKINRGFKPDKRAFVRRK